MADLAKLIVSLEAQTAKYQKGLDQANRRLKRFERNQRKQLGQITAAFKVLGAAAIAFGTTQLARVGRATVDYADNLQKLNDRLGISVEALSELQFAAERSGVPVRALQLGLQRLQRRVAEAAQGTGEAQGALRELGIDAQRLARLPLDQQFELVGEALSLVGNEADQTRLAFKLFDAEGVALLQTLKGGSAGLRDLRSEARRLGVTVSTEAAQAAAKLNDRITDLKAAFKGLSASILESGAIEALTQFIEKTNQLFFGLSEEQKLVADLNALYTRLSDARSGGVNEGNEEQIIQQILDAQKRLADLRNQAAREGAAAGPTLASVQAPIEEVVSRDALRGVLVAERKISEQTEQIFADAEDRARKLNSITQQLGFTFESAFEDAVLEGDKLRDVLQGLLKDIIRIGLRLSVTGPLGNFLGGSFAGFFANGGRIGAGQFGVVGEAGPEFVAGPATVTPMSAGGGLVINQTVNATGADSEVRRALPGLLEQNREATIASIIQLRNEGRF